MSRWVCHYYIDSFTLGAITSGVLYREEQICFPCPRERGQGNQCMLTPCGSIFNAPAGWEHTSSVAGVGTPGHEPSPGGWGPGVIICSGGGHMAPPLFSYINQGDGIPGAS